MSTRKVAFNSTVPSQPARQSARQLEKKKADTPGSPTQELPQDIADAIGAEIIMGEDPQSTELSEEQDLLEYPPSPRAPTPSNSRIPLPDDDDDEADQGDLAKSLKLLADSIRQQTQSATINAITTPAPTKPPVKKNRVKEPDTFDGSDPRKINPFLVQCQLHFAAHPDSYRSSTDKVTFALSYLRGTAASWYEPYLMNLYRTRPTWMDKWSEFTETLTENFGLADPVADAEAELDNLVMKDHHKILKYNVAFNRLAALVGWGDSALTHRYYKGLPNRIKDAMIDGRPAGFISMRTKAQQIDTRHWERESEKSRSAPKSEKRSHSDDSKSSSDKHKHNRSKQDSGDNSKSKSSNTSHSHTSSKSKSDSSDLTNKLTKDGKLTEEERTRRFKNQLCLFCGHPGHRREDCKKRQASEAKAKARAAQLSAASDSAESSKK